MSAQILREAASLMRSRAEAATPGPWSNGDSDVSANSDLIYDDPRWPGQAVLPSDGPMEVAECYRHEARGERQANAAHIAALHPAVALAVADWLDSEADAFEAYMDRQTDPARRMNAVWLVSAQERHNHALAVATAYLGTP